MSNDVVIIVGFVLTSLGVVMLYLAYAFPYNDLVTRDVGTISSYRSAREMESAELRVWTAFTILWVTALSLITVGLIMITSAVVYDSCECQNPETTDDDSIPLSAQVQTVYGSSDNRWQWARYNH